MAGSAVEWHDFYVMAGGAAAALAGLILVALSLHLRAILAHPLYRERSFSSLQGLVTIVLVSGAVLSPQPIVALGAEVLVLGLSWLIRFALFIRLFRSEQSSRRRSPGPDRRWRWTFEWVGWGLWLVALFGGGIFLFSEAAVAFYLLAFWVASGLALVVWNAWVLMSELET